jgi:ABC-2 type transport system ATP-binding protein
MIAIELRNLCKSLHATPIIEQFSLQIAAGETLGLLGPDGAGKTTLLNMMSGLIVPDSGAIEIMGYHLPREAGKVQGYKLSKSSLSICRQTIYSAWVRFKGALSLRACAMS